MLAHTLTFETLRSYLLGSAHLHNDAGLRLTDPRDVYCENDSDKYEMAPDRAPSLPDVTVRNSDRDGASWQSTLRADRNAAVMIIIYCGQHMPLPAALPCTNPYCCMSASPHSLQDHDNMPPCNPMIIMTSKSTSLKIHAGEMSFPGGKVDDSDENLLYTALRETREEIGLGIQRKHVLGRLEAVRTRNSGFLITPFVAMLDERPLMRPNSEVSQIFELPLGALLDTASADTDPSHNPVSGMYAFDSDDLHGNTVWGASALILKQIYDMVCW